MASCGHVRDLPAKEMGVDFQDDFKPKYVETPQGKKFLGRLKEAAKKADKVYLATDPDREGEAIAWHLQQCLKLKSPVRVAYAEITEKAVKEAIQSGRSIDMNLVRAQEGRRVLDRLVGYGASPFLRRLLNESVSAGRVQTPAVRLVVEREEAIRTFSKTTHYGVELIFDGEAGPWRAHWLPKLGWLPDGTEYFLDKETAENVARHSEEAVVTKFSCREALQPPPPALTTSSLQQAASSSLKLSPKRTMELAQNLYEAGDITYMRTDSPNLSEEAEDAARAEAFKLGWMVSASKRKFKSKEGAQEAHEAVRPTHFDKREAGSGDDERALYRLIWARAMASQLADACNLSTQATLEASISGIPAVFEAKGSKPLSPGWKIALQDGGEDEDEREGGKEAPNPVPILEIGARLIPAGARTLTKETKPPQRYTEATLIKALEKSGVGRPSTYAAIMDRIVRGGYVSAEKRKLHATALGERIVNSLRGFFSFAEIDYTKGMEDGLDLIAKGQSSYLQLVKGAWGQLSSEISNHQGPPMDGGHKCPVCGKDVIHRVRKDEPGKKGFDFWSCAGYPECKAKFDEVGGKPVHRKIVDSGFNCPDCGKTLVHRTRKDTPDPRGFDFRGCTGYPDCRVTFKPKNDGTPDFDTKSP